MVDPRRGDEAAFINFTRMPPEMLDDHETAHLVSGTTNRPPPPGMELRHLASGLKYAAMIFGWRVPHNTISVIVQEVCEAISAEYA